SAISRAGPMTNTSRARRSLLNGYPYMNSNAAPAVVNEMPTMLSARGDASKDLSVADQVSCIAPAALGTAASEPGTIAAAITMMLTTANMTWNQNAHSWSEKCNTKRL